jgi:hypothetical protein
MKSGHKVYLNIRNTFLKEGFPRFKDFPFDFGLAQETYGLEKIS